MVSLLNTALSGSTLSIDSPTPLRIGSLLSALVQDTQTLKFVPLSSRQEQLAVTQQLVSQQSRQGSLDGLIKVLQNLPPSDQTSSDLRAAVDKLLAGLPDVQQLSTPKGLAQALANSGLFLEAKLLTGQNPTLVPDMKGDLPADRPTDAGPAGQHQSQRNHRRQHPGPGHAEFCAQCPRHARASQCQTVANQLPTARAPVAKRGRRR